MAGTSKQLLVWAASFALAAFTPLAVAPRVRAPVPSVWQRVTFAPLAIPGTFEHMDVRVSQEVIVGAGSDRAYRPIGSSGKFEPSFLRFDLEWSAMDDAQCQPVPKPAPISNGANVHISFHHGAAVVHAKEPMDWMGVSNACGTTWFRTEFFPTDVIGVEPVWFEVQAADRTYWVELPQGLARNPSSPAGDETARGSAKLPSYLTALTDKDVLIPWASVRYALDRGGFVDLVDACDGVARVTLNDTSRFPIDQPSIRVEIRRADGTIFTGREISRSIGPRQSVFDFKSRSGAPARTWDALAIEVDSASTVVTIPSSLYLLGLRLASWGDMHRVPVPDSSCKN